MELRKLFLKGEIRRLKQLLNEVYEHYPYVRYWIPSNGIIIRSYKWLIIDCAVDTCARH